MRGVRVSRQRRISKDAVENLFLLIELGRDQVLIILAARHGKFDVTFNDRLLERLTETYDLRLQLVLSRMMQIRLLDR